MADATMSNSNLRQEDLPVVSELGGHSCLSAQRFHTFQKILQGHPADLMATRLYWRPPPWFSPALRRRSQGVRFQTCSGWASLKISATKALELLTIDVAIPNTGPNDAQLIQSLGDSFPSAKKYKPCPWQSSFHATGEDPAASTLDVIPQDLGGIQGLLKAKIPSNLLRPGATDFTKKTPARTPTIKKTLHLTKPALETFQNKVPLP